MPVQTEQHVWTMWQSMIVYALMVIQVTNVKRVSSQEHLSILFTPKLYGDHCSCSLLYEHTSVFR